MRSVRDNAVPAVNRGEAKAQFSRLVALVETGSEKEIIIARNGRPVARLVGLETQPAGIRIGLARGQFVAPEDIDEANDEIAKLFGVSG
jgi:prevent-host-death family protein